MQNGKPPILIQCKVSKDKATARRLIEDFKKNPPLESCAFYRQRMEVKIKHGETLTTEL